MDKYLITKNTLALLPIDSKSTKIIERYITFNIYENTKDIIDYNCLINYSSFKGRCDATDFLIGVKYKCPIIISEKNEIIFFPTKSPIDNMCSWINMKEISKYYSAGKYSYIVFNNKKIIKLTISSNILSNQILKSYRLETFFKSKK